MTKDIRQIRRAIKKRKKQQEQTNPNLKHSKTYPMIQEEEKHGFQPSVYNPGEQNTQRNKSQLPHMTVKLLTCFVFFSCTALILSNDHERLMPAKSWLTGQLQEEFPFAKAKDWYETTFGGTPLSIAPQGSSQQVDSDDLLLPVMGQVEESFQSNGTGIMISPEEKSVINSIDDGIVIFAGKDSETGKKITVQHSDGSNTTYGHLNAVHVHAYEQVQANERIGTFTPTETNEVVYFSIEKDNQYIDPAQVIPVDDLP